jgi:hypothetical protein
VSENEKCGRESGERIFFGEEPDNCWSMPDPHGERTSAELYGLRYPAPGTRPKYYAAAVCDAYEHLLMYPNTDFVVRQLRTIRRYIRERSKK